MTTQTSAEKAMATVPVVWDIYTHFYFFQSLVEKLKPASLPGLRKQSIKSVILLHDNFRRHTVQLTQETLKKRKSVPSLHIA